MELNEDSVEEFVAQMPLESMFYARFDMEYGDKIGFWGIIIMTPFFNKFYPLNDFCTRFISF